MNIFGAIYDFIQALRQALLDIIQPLVMPDWGWLVGVVLPLVFVLFVLLYFVYLWWLYRRNAWAMAERRPPRLQGRLNPPPGVHASPPSWWPVALSIGFFFGLLGLVAANGLLLGFGVLVVLMGAWGWLRSANREWRRAETSAVHGPSAHGTLAAGMAPPAGALTAGVGAASAIVPPSRALVPQGAIALATATSTEHLEHALEAPPGVHMPAPSWWPVYASLAAFFGLLGLVVNAALLAGGIVLALLAFVGWYVDSYRELKVAEGIAPRPHVRDPRAVYPRVLARVGALTVALSVAFAVGPSFIGRVFPSQAAGGPGASGGPACTPTPQIEITAQNTKFSSDQLCIPANTPFHIVFHNKDQIPHNLSVATFFSGDVFSGPGDRTYDVPPIPAGSYKFICVVHPTVMFGTATVVAAGPGGGGGPAPPGGPLASPSGSPAGGAPPGAATPSPGAPPASP